MPYLRHPLHRFAVPLSRRERLLRLLRSQQMGGRANESRHPKHRMICLAFNLLRLYATLFDVR